MKSRDLMLTSLLASLYVGIGLVVPMISFGGIQCRIGDALYPLIAVLGMPALFGLTLGHFVYNFLGYQMGFALGVLDVIISPALFFIAKVMIARYGFKAVPIHVLFVALWVPYLLNSMFGLPYWSFVLSVGIGEFIAEVLIGIPLAKEFEKQIRIDTPKIKKGNIKDGFISR